VTNLSVKQRELKTGAGTNQNTTPAVQRVLHVCPAQRLTHFPEPGFDLPARLSKGDGRSQCLYDPSKLFSKLPVRHRRGARGGAPDRRAGHRLRVRLCPEHGESAAVCRVVAAGQLDALPAGGLQPGDGHPDQLGAPGNARGRGGKRRRAGIARRAHLRARAGGQCLSG